MIKMFENFNNAQWEISPDNSANWANLTIDKKGDYIFFHRSNKRLYVIDPNKYGSNPANITSKGELSSLSKVGGMSMYYTDKSVAEPGTGEYTHVVKISSDKVYDFNVDPNNYWEIAKEKIGRGPKSPNDQIAWVTKLACDDGWDMVVSLWMKNLTRAQTTKKLVPFDYSYSEGPTLKKRLEGDYISNKDLGWNPFIPKYKFEKFIEFLRNLEMKKYRYGIYDDIYHLRNDYYKYSENELIDIIKKSDLKEEDKSKLIHILESKDGNYKSIK